MQQINSDIIREVPRHYLHLGVGAAGLLTFSTVLLMACVGGAASVYAPQEIWKAVSATGVLGGITLAALVLSLIRRAKQVMDSLYNLLTSVQPVEPPVPTVIENKIIPVSASGYDGRVPSELGESEAQAHFRTALEIAKLAFASQSLEKDGTPVRGKSFQFRRCQELGIVTEHRDWLAALQLLEQAGAGENLTQGTGYRWHVSNSANVENVLQTYYLRHGYIKYNGNWTKR